MNMNAKIIPLAFAALLLALVVSGCIGSQTGAPDNTGGSGTGSDNLDAQQNEALSGVQAGIVDESENIEIGEMV